MGQWSRGYDPGNNSDKSNEDLSGIFDGFLKTSFFSFFVIIIIRLLLENFKFILEVGS